LKEDEVTDLEIFKAFIKDRFGFTHCDVGQTHDGKPWVSFADGETYTFFNFSYEDDSFTGCFSRRYSDHTEIETPAPMLGLRDDFQELRDQELREGEVDLYKGDLHGKRTTERTGD